MPQGPHVLHSLHPVALTHLPPLQAWQTPSFERTAPFEKQRLL
jgi:hypothetical protein